MKLGEQVAGPNSELTFGQGWRGVVVLFKIFPGLVVHRERSQMGKEGGKGASRETPPWTIFLSLRSLLPPFRTNSALLTKGAFEVFKHLL